MTLQQLKYILAIADTGSFNKAAESLYVAQPSLSEAVKELENDLGITIFNRSSRGVTLTNDGLEFLSYARALLGQYEIIEERFSRTGNFKKHFGVSTQHYSFAVKAFINTINQYNANEFEFAIRESRTMDVIDDVYASRSEIGLLYLSEFNRSAMKRLFSSRNLDFQVLTSCGIYVYMSSSHPLAEKDFIQKEDLNAFPCLVFEQGAGSTFYHAEEALNTNDFPKIIKANDRATMLNLMIGMDGFTLCCGHICEELNGSGYVAVPFRDEAKEDLKVDLIYIVRKDIRLSTIGEAFIRELQDYLEKAGIQ